MAENKHTPDLEQLHNPGVKHEANDVNARALTRFGIIFALGLIGSLFIVFYVFDTFRGAEAEKGPPPSQGVNVDARKLPPNPRLQSAEIEDFKQMRAAEDKILNGYEWVDQQHGSVRIPISRAMDLIAQENLPHRNAPPPVTDNATVPTESGLGPIMTQVGGPLSPNRTFPPDQPLLIRGTGNSADGRQAGGPPTPPQFSLGNIANGVTPPEQAGGAGQQQSPEQKKAAPQQQAAPRQP
jgi:hypothetical protein